MAIITSWGTVKTDYAGKSHTDAVHDRPVYSLSGSFDTSTGKFIGRIFKSDTGGGFFNSKFGLVWRLWKSDDSYDEVLMTDYYGTNYADGTRVVDGVQIPNGGQKPKDFDSTVNLAGYTKAVLYMTCNHSVCDHKNGAVHDDDPIPINPMVGDPLPVSQEIQLTQKPTLTFLSNADPYTDSDNVEHPTVSSNTDKILIAYTYSGSRLLLAA